MTCSSSPPSVRIGGGGAATVYAATTADGHDVAVKIMSTAHAELTTAAGSDEDEDGDDGEAKGMTEDVCPACPKVEDPEPTPPRKSDESRKNGSPRKPKPRPDSAASPACDEQVEAANEANRSKQWSRVLELTQSTRCWPDASARTRIRIRALSELGRYSECAKLGSTSSVAAIKRVANHCAKQLGNEDGSQ